MICATEGDNEATLTAQAEKWLVTRFSEHDTYLSVELYEEGKTYGFGTSILKKAKQHLGIDATKEAFDKPWMWKCHSFLKP